MSPVFLMLFPATGVSPCSRYILGLQVAEMTALGDSPQPRFAPLRDHGYGTLRLRHGPYDECLDGVSDALAYRLRAFTYPGRARLALRASRAGSMRRACNLPLTETARLGDVSPSRISRIQAELEKGERLETREAIFRWF